METIQFYGGVANLVEPLSKPYLDVPVACIRPYTVPVGLEPLPTVQKVIKLFATEEMTALKTLIETKARDFIHMLKVHHSPEITEYIIERINNNPAIVKGLEDHKMDRGGCLVRRFPIPGYDKTPCVMSGRSFQSEPVMAAIDEFNLVVASLNELDTRQGYDIYIACSSLINSFKVNWANKQREL